MYLRKVRGPRSVTLPNGQIVTRADLPSASVRRWVASRKAIVAAAVVHDLLSKQEAMERYDLSDEELSGWIDAYSKFGESALRTTSLQRYRQPQVE